MRRCMKIDGKSRAEYQKRIPRAMPHVGTSSQVSMGGLRFVIRWINGCPTTELERRGC
jgi:hypothetical protein